MHRLEITGATPEDLFMNAVRMLSVLLKGGAQTTAPVENTVELWPNGKGAPPVEKPTPEASEEEEQIPRDPPAPAKPRRGRAATKASTADLNDDISDVGGAATGQTIEHDPKEIDGKPPTLTLDGDIKPRLRAIQAAAVERGMNMKESVAYIMKLYGPFGITKADQLKPEQFAELMEASEGYLSGEA